jgi:hypothetical protein
MPKRCHDVIKQKGYWIDYWIKLFFIFKTFFIVILFFGSAEHGRSNDVLDFMHMSCDNRVLKI